MSRTVSKLNGDFGRRSRIFPVYNAIAERFPVGIFNGGGAQEIGSCGHVPTRRRKEFDDTCVRYDTIPE